MTRVPGHEVEAVVCGEVRTCLLQTSAAMTGAEVEHLLRLRPDARVLRSERPNQYAASPDVLTGIDCLLPTRSGGKARGVGTVQSHAVLTQGRVLQVGTFFQVASGPADQRMPWGHYLARPGIVEALGRFHVSDLAEGFLGGDSPAAGVLDAGAVAERLIEEVGRHPLLDRRAPFKSRRTRLRWTAVRDDERTAPGIDEYTVAADGLRTVAIRLPGVGPATSGAAVAASVAAFSEDLALHDWLLTTLAQMVERGRLGSTAGPDALQGLRPAVDHLLHVWMPMARVDPLLAPMWDVLEETPGFSRQWQNLAQRIRDQLAMRTMQMMQSLALPGTSRTAG